jgi:hypothetical protein
MRALRRLAEDSGDDPLQGVANFFDLGIVFALGFMVERTWRLFAGMGKNWSDTA